MFNYCAFYYGGNGGYHTTLNISDSITTVTNCTFVTNTGGKSGDFYYGALNSMDSLTGTVITGNRFYNNTLPLSIETTYNIDDSNIFQNTDGSLINTYNGIFVNSTNEIETAISWGETEVAFVINDNDLYIESGASLTLANDVVLKFTSGSELVIPDGESDLVNHGGTGVYFSSYKDDALKGDTNGDGTATSPASGDWVGIYDGSGVTSDPYYFLWTNIFYDTYAGNTH